MDYVFDANVWFSCVAWTSFGVVATFHLRDTNRLRKHLDDYHPDWWPKLLRTDRQRERWLKYYFGRAPMLRRLIYFGRSLPDRLPDPEFDRLLRNSRRSGLIATSLLTLSIISTAWLPFNPASHMRP